MYSYDELYERIIENTESVNLPAEESIKIIDKVYNDLQIGLLKPRNITKKANKLICNSLARQNKQRENLTIEYYKVSTFINKIKSKLVISDDELKELESRLLKLDEITDETLNRGLNQYLEEIGNDSLKMIKNRSFRELDQAIITIDNSKLAKRYGLSDESLVFYGFIDHKLGLLFELLREDNDENFILPKSELDLEVIKYLDKEDIDTEEYREIRGLEFLDKFRDAENPDVITVKFIDNGHYEYLKVRLESIIGSKLLGTLLDNPQKISGLSLGDEVVITYCYDYTDNIHVYVNNCTNELATILKEVSKSLKDSSREVILKIFSQYQDSAEFEIIIDAFHSIIFDYFRDLNEFYRELNKVGFECI